MKKIIIPIIALALVGCSSFVNTSQKSLYVAGQLADGSVKSYSVWWKDQTNKLGATSDLMQKQAQVISMANQVGTSIQLADNSIRTYQGLVGTNITTTAVVSALVGAAIQNAGQIASFIAAETGDTNFFSHP
jgi:hypothetical protein